MSDSDGIDLMMYVLGPLIALVLGPTIAGFIILQSGSGLDSAAWGIRTLFNGQVTYNGDLVIGWAVIGIAFGAAVGLFLALKRTNRTVIGCVVGIPIMVLPFLVAMGGQTAELEAHHVWPSRSRQQVASPSNSSYVSNSSPPSNVVPTPAPAPAPQPSGPRPECSYDGECGQDRVCRDGKCTTDWWCMCYKEHAGSYGSVVVSTGCRRGRDVCANLERVANKGGRILVENGVVRPCRPYPSEHPGDLLGGRYGWEPSKRPGALQKVGTCAIP